MKKGIIMEKRRNYVIVLTADGSFEKGIHLNEHALVGEEVCFHTLQRKSNKRKLLFIKLWSIVLLFTLSFLLTHFVSQHRAYAYIHVDINPSIELKVDENLNVLEISAQNKDALQIVEHLDELEISQLEAIISEIMADCEKQGVARNGKEILIGVNNPSQIENHMTTDIKAFFKEFDTDWQIITFSVPDEVRERAVENETSMNEEFATYLDTMDDSVLETTPIDEEKRNQIHSFYNTNHQTKEFIYQ